MFVLFTTYFHDQSCTRGGHPWREITSPKLRNFINDLEISSAKDAKTFRCQKFSRAGTIDNFLPACRGNFKLCWLKELPDTIEKESRQNEQMKQATWFHHATYYPPFLPLRALNHSNTLLQDGTVHHCPSMQREDTSMQHSLFETRLESPRSSSAAAHYEANSDSGIPRKSGPISSPVKTGGDAAYPIFVTIGNGRLLTTAGCLMTFCRVLHEGENCNQYM